MKPRRTVQLVLMSTAVAGPLILGQSDTLGVSQRTAPNECRVTISGAERPTWLPSQDVWEAAFERYTTGTPSISAVDLSGETRARLRASASLAIVKAKALRESLPVAPTPGIPPQTVLDRDLVIADAFLDARDETLRAVSNEDFDALTAYAEGLSRVMVVSLPIAGRAQTAEDGTRTCELKVNGDEYPHLIPEHKAWSFLFESWAAAVSYNIATKGDLTDEYLRAVQRVSFPMAFSEIRSFLQIAATTSNRIAKLKEAGRGAESESRDLELEIQRTVMSGRREVLRALTPEGWRAVLRRFDETRLSGAFWYRSKIEG